MAQTLTYVVDPENSDPEDGEFYRNHTVVAEASSREELRFELNRRDLGETVTQEGRLVQKLTHLQVEIQDPEESEMMAHENDARTIVVTGLKPGTTDESIRYFFENTRKSGGGPVEWVERLEETRALVHFVSREDAESARAKPLLKLEGNILQASAQDLGHHHYLVTDSVSLQASIPAASEFSGALVPENTNTDSDQTVESSKNDDSQNPSSQLNVETFTRKQTIPNLNLSQLKMLNNPRVLGKIYKECPGVEICVDTNAQIAHVKASEKVIQQTCTFVQSLIGSVGEVTLSLSPALFKMHEKEHHIEWIWRTTIDDLNLVCHWELLDQTLVICAPSSILLLLERLFRSLFVEIRVHLEEWEVNLLNSAWLLFMEVLQNDNGGCPIPVLLLENRGVIIVDTPSSISQTQLALRQFLDKHRKKVSVSSDGDGGDVSMEEQLSVSQVCREIPNLKSGQLKVLSCPRIVEKWYGDYPDLQICVDQEKKMAVVKASETTVKKAFVEVMYFVTLVREVRVPLSPALVRMYEKEDSREWVDAKLMDSGCRCHWEISDQHAVVSGHSSQLSHFEKMFKFFFKEITFHLEKRETALLTSDVWTRFVEDQQRYESQRPAPVLLLEDDRVIIVDVPENVRFMEMAVRQLLDELTPRGDPSPVVDEDWSLQGQCSPIRVCEDCIPHLRPEQLSILSMARAVDKLYKQFPGLTVHTDREEKAVVIRAPENIMPDAFSAVLCYVTLIKEARIPLSPALLEMYETGRNKEWVQQSLIDKYELVCQWDVCDGHLVISAESAKLKRMEHMFRSLFQEVKVCLDKKVAESLTPSVWESFVDGQRKMREGNPTPVLLLNDDCVTVVDSPSKVSATQLAVKQFLNELGHGDATSNDITGCQCPCASVEQNTISDLNPGQLRVLSCPTTLGKLHKEYPGLQVSVDRDNRTAVVRAPEDVIKNAFADVQTLINNVRELKVLLSPALAQMFEKDDSKAWIQKTLIEKYALVCHWELHDQNLVISAQSAKLFRLEHLFRSVFKELQVSLKEWEAGTLTPSVFKSYVREQERDRKETPTPVLVLKDNRVTIVDIAAKVKDTQLALIQLLNDLGSLNDLGDEFVS